MSDEDIVVTDKELFDQATSVEAPVETPVETPPVAEATTEDKPERARDEQGRFVRAETPAEPAKVEAPKFESAKAEPKEQDHRVPLRELLDTRERAQKAERELEQLKAWQQQILWQQQQSQRLRQQPQEPPSIFDNPDTYLGQRVIAPLQQWGQMSMMQVKDGLSREMANTQFTEQVVNDALAEMGKVRQTPEGNFAYQQIMSSGHPYGALVKWYQEAKTRQEIGPDPKAWLNKQLEERKKDPAFQAEILKLIREQQTTSGRPPVVSLPPSLSSVPATAGKADDAGDLSDQSLYSFATR